MSKFKDNWEKIDEHCPYCNAVTKQAKGINKQNLKRLIAFRKPTYVEVMVMVFLLLFLLSSIAYRHDTAICRDYVEKNRALWENYTNGTFEIIIQPRIDDLKLNLTGFE